MGYLRLRAHNVLVATRKRQLEAMRRGFNILPWREALKRFTAKDMILLLCGPSSIDAEQIIANIDFTYGNWGRSKTLEHLREHLRSLTEAQLRCFLKFVTGSPSLPYGGLGSSSG